ncbi:MAG: putative toxin-antitoxin system toxin component, PIN family [Lewinellaceae bacterium]|nr:putative toxin-antitoxin system toxin component, PIN family [Lewinellaceae bacterium]
MKVVLDTNVLLIALPLSSPYRHIYDSLLQEKYTLVVTTEILNEYEEILSKQITPTIAENVIRLLLSLPNIEKKEVYYRWGLIDADSDDNKFVDCAIAANARFVVTEDKHFNVLKGVNFPKVNVINSDEFQELLRDGNN